MQTTITFFDGEQVTSTKLNQIVSGLSFVVGDIVGASLAVVGGKLKVGIISSSEMGPLSVSTGSLQDGSVTTVKLADGSLTTAKLANLAVTGPKIALGEINFAHLSVSLPATQAQMYTRLPGYLVTPDNIKFSPHTAKACGEFDVYTTTRPIRDHSLNLASVTRIDATHTQVTFTTAMLATNYTAIANLSFAFVTPTTADAQNCIIYDKQTTGFKVMHTSEVFGRSVTFLVFGPYA